MDNGFVLPDPDELMLDLSDPKDAAAYQKLVDQYADVMVAKALAEAASFNQADDNERLAKRLHAQYGDEDDFPETLQNALEAMKADPSLDIDTAIEKSRKKPDQLPESLQGKGKPVMFGSIVEIRKKGGKR